MKSEIAALASYPSVSESEVSSLKSYVSTLESQSSVETDQEPQSLSESQGVSTQPLSGSQGASSTEYKWVHGKRILTDYSPEMIKYRAEQAESGTPVNDRILSCVRAVKTEDGRILIDLRGSALPRKLYKPYMKSLVNNLRIDNKPVEENRGVSHEKDHVLPTTTANWGGLRDKDESRDEAMVVILDGEEHQFRTNYHKKHPLICDTENFTQNIFTLTKAIPVSDRAIWNGSEGENEGKDQPRIVPGPSGLASDHVIGVYEYAHRIDMERMWVDMLLKGYGKRQALCYSTAEMTGENVTDSVERFATKQFPFPENVDTSKLDKLTSLQRAVAAELYSALCRRDNLIHITSFVGNHVKMLNCHMLYAESPDGLAKGCTLGQFVHVGKIKELCMHVTKIAIQKGVEVPLLAHGFAFDEDRTEYTLTMILNYARVSDQLTSEELRRSMIYLGPVVGAQHMYIKPAKFLVQTPTEEEGKQNFDQAVGCAETAPKGELQKKPRVTTSRAASPSSQQEVERLKKQEAERLEKQRAEKAAAKAAKAEVRDENYFKGGRTLG